MATSQNMSLICLKLAELWSTLHLSYPGFLNLASVCDEDPS